MKLASLLASRLSESTCCTLYDRAFSERLMQGGHNDRIDLLCLFAEREVHLRAASHHSLDRLITQIIDYQDRIFSGGWGTCSE